MKSPLGCVHIGCVYSVNELGVQNWVPCWGYITIGIVNTSETVPLFCPLFDEYIYFIFDVVFVVKKDIFPRGPLIRVERAEAWVKVGETIVSNVFFSSCVWR